MISSLINTELIKYKRTIIPWMILIGGLLTSGTAMLLVSTENPQVDWDTFAVRGLNCMNLLALLLVAVFTGFVFVGEYHENIDKILFTYPVSRLKFFISKFFVVFLLDISLYLVFFIFTMLFGLTYIGYFPALKFCLKLIEITLILAVIHFVLVPVTVLVSILIKGVGTYLFMGMGYFMLYISFINSDYSSFIPVCIPDKLVANYFISEIISRSDIIGIVAVCTITFLSTFILGAVYYSRQDV